MSNFFKDLAEEAAAWAAIGGKPIEEEIRVQSMSLVDFLELISTIDFKFRYEPGNPRTYGIEFRHKILKNWIIRLKDAGIKL